MQHVFRESREPAEAATSIEIAGNGRCAYRTQLARALGMMRERDHAGRSGTRAEERQCAHADIAASDDQHTRTAQDSSGDHAEHCIRRFAQRAREQQENTSTPLHDIHLWLST